VPLFLEAEVPPPPRKRGWALLSWLVILLAVAGIVLVRWLPLQETGGPAEDDAVGLVVMHMQARTWVGFAAVTGQRAEVYEQARVLNTGSVAQRLRFIPVAGELAGPREALDRLADLDERLARAGIHLDKE